MAMFKGFSQIDISTLKPRAMCAVLAIELARTNEAMEALAEELKQLKAAQKKGINDTDTKE